MTFWKSGNDFFGGGEYQTEIDVGHQFYMIKRNISFLFRLVDFWMACKKSKQKSAHPSTNVCSYSILGMPKPRPRPRPMHYHTIYRTVLVVITNALYTKWCLVPTNVLFHRPLRAKLPLAMVRSEDKRIDRPWIIVFFSYSYTWKLAQNISSIGS